MLKDTVGLGRDEWGRLGQRSVRVSQIRVSPRVPVVAIDVGSSTWKIAHQNVCTSTEVTRGRCVNTIEGAEERGDFSKNHPSPRRRKQISTKLHSLQTASFISAKFSWRLPDSRLPSEIISVMLKRPRILLSREKKESNAA